MVGEVMVRQMVEGYIPDGYGVLYDYKKVKPGAMVRLDDDLNLCFIKMLGSK